MKAFPKLARRQVWLVTIHRKSELLSPGPSYSIEKIPNEYVQAGPASLISTQAIRTLGTPLHSRGLSHARIGKQGGQSSQRSPN